jgi:hypothetical protein
MPTSMIAENPSARLVASRSSGQASVQDGSGWRRSTVCLTPSLLKNRIPASPGPPNKASTKTAMTMSSPDETAPGGTPCPGGIAAMRAGIERETASIAQASTTPSRTRPQLAIRLSARAQRRARMQPTPTTMQPTATGA